MEFLTADKVDLDTLREGANDAFSDYTIPSPAMPPAVWREMLRQRSFDAELSWVAVENGEVDAYWLVGAEPATRPGASYGISVGTRPRARRQGLSRKLWAQVLGRLRDRDFTSHVLEVIETNDRAVPLYQALGFAVARRVECFKGAAPELEATDLSFRDVSIDEAERIGAAWRDWQPTWQNATEAVRNVADRTAATLAFRGETPVGFGYFYKAYGQVTQITVDPTHRRTGVGRALLAHWGAAHEKEVMAILNIPDTDESSTGFFRGLGWQNHVNQFDMRIEL